VVCVPNAFASNLETWFGRIIDSRGHGSDGSSSSSNIIAPLTGSLAAGLPGSSSRDKRSESSWDSGMYMKRLGQVLDTLQVRLLSVQCLDKRAHMLVVWDETLLHCLNTATQAQTAALP
jgi:hypothetical protein